MVPGVRARTLLALLAVSCVGACRKSGSAAGDGGTDATPGDVPSGDLPGALALDFTATGCPAYVFKDTEQPHPQCTGTPPLTLSFSAVSSPSLTRFLWTFGDGTASSTERAPTHTYVLPGTYDVSLVAEGTVGSVSRTNKGFVFVAPLLEGSPCDVDAQCDTALSCLCGAGRSCGPAFARGICTRGCAASACGDRSVCATLEVPAVRASATAGDAGASPLDGAADALDAADDADAATVLDAASDAPVSSDAAGDATASGDAAGLPASGAQLVCLAGCDGVPCPAGLVCRALPAASGGTARWALACVPQAFREVGDTCRDATGALTDELCATGHCAALGALGVCSATCGAGEECPAGSACAKLGDGRSLCLRACGSGFACDRDPLLRCEAAGSAGPLGFQVTPAVPDVTYCAPRKCAAQSECSPAGTCVPLGAGGHCLLP
jgi:PKD repeat protein